MAFQQSGERSGSDSQASRLPACSPGGQPASPGGGEGSGSALPWEKGLKRGDACVNEDGPAGGGGARTHHARGLSPSSHARLLALLR